MQAETPDTSSSEGEWLSNTIAIAIEWGHCDPARIVFYPNYFTWFDQGTRHLFDAAGLTFQAMLDEYRTVALPLVDAHAEFLRPSRFGDTIEVTSTIAEWRRKTVVLSHLVTNAGEVCVRGREVRVWAAPHPDDPSRLETREIPEALRARFSV